MACHGPDGKGNAQAGFPALSGQFAEYTIAQLKAYKDGSRRTGINKMMQEVAAKLSDEEIEAVAHYVAGLH
jgi:cytochrome c553